MSEFVYLFRNGEKMSPETMKVQMGKWIAWMKELGDSGRSRAPATRLSSSRGRRPVRS